MSDPARPVVLVAEELAPGALAVLAADFEVRHCDGADRADLLRAVPAADALVVRSATTVDAEVLAAGRRLTVVARAGVGLDNVDVPAATARGVLVVNAPTSNIVSAAEHAVALLLAAARHIPAAHASLNAGRWQRSAFTGVEVAGKTVGVVGLGRVGVLVAQRMAAFDTRLLAYDPYVPAARAAQLGVQLVGLDELLAAADFVSLHLPKTPETVGLIGERELALMRPHAILVNAARGGLVDEAALAQALADGRIGGAAIDVYAHEPCLGSPLFGVDRVVATPHLGASTVEAQDKAGLAVARSVSLALRGEFVPDAVNVQAGGVVAEELRPALPLLEKLGRLFTALAGHVASRIAVEVRGEIAAHEVGVLPLAALKGVFADVVSEPVSYVNAPLLAADRGVDVQLRTDSDAGDFRNLLTVRGTLADGAQTSVSGTLSGPRHLEKLTEIDGFDVDVPASGHMAFFRYADRPGIVGIVGHVLGEADVNIASMQVARRSAGGLALMVLSVDSPVPAETVAAIGARIGAEYVRSVSLPDAVR